jgi:hypothetical protein
MRTGPSTHPLGISTSKDLLNFCFIDPPYAAPLWWWCMDTLRGHVAFQPTVAELFTRAQTPALIMSRSFFILAGPNL